MNKKVKLLLLVFLCTGLCGKSQIISPNGNNFFYYNGAADLTFRYLERGSGGRAMVHDSGNMLTFNYGGDFTGGVKIGDYFHVANSGKLNIRNQLETNDYANIGQHQGQLRLLNNPGTYGTRPLELALLDNGAAVIQANEQNVGYNPLLLNPVSGNVGIGTTNPQEKLSVNGKIRAKEIKVETANWSDYVFEESYQLPDLKETEHFIKTNKHLPGIPSAKEIEEHGVSLGEMNAKLLKKVEELTLHIIDLKKEVEILKSK